VFRALFVAEALFPECTNMSMPKLTRPTAEAVIVVLPATNAALDGMIESIPNPNAATVVSAMRLKTVLVDIDFLSLVDPEDFSRSAW
jgi:hypothetical protein